MEYMQALTPGNGNDLEAEAVTATVATLSQNEFEVPRNEGDISHLNWTSNATSSGYETFTEELEGLDEHVLAAGFVQRLAPDDVEDQFQMQAHTENKSPSYSAPEGQSFRRSGQRPTSVEVPKLDPTPGLPSPSSIPIFHLADLAYTKLIIHALKHAPKTVNGVLLGRISVSDASIAIVDAVPLQHHWLLDLSSYTDVGLNMVGSTLLYLLLY